MNTSDMLKDRVYGLIIGHILADIIINGAETEITSDLLSSMEKKEPVNDLLHCSLRVLLNCKSFEEALRGLTGIHEIMWCSIIDLALHGVPKRSISNPLSYMNIYGVEESFPRFAEIMSIFNNTVTLKEGLDQCIRENLSTEDTILYCQLAGCHYRLTGIPMDSILMIKENFMISRTVEEFLKKI